MRYCIFEMVILAIIENIPKYTSENQTHKKVKINIYVRAKDFSRLG